MVDITKNAVPVFLVTRTGVGYTDDGIRAVRDFVLGDDPEFAPEIRAKIKSQLPPNADAILLHSGPDLLDPTNLADLLEDTANARLVLSFGDRFATINDIGGKGFESVIKNLRTAAERNVDSWTVLNATSDGNKNGG